MTMPLDYSLIAGILGEYLGTHPEHEDLIANAIVRLSADLDNADLVDGVSFWHTAHHASLV